MLYLAETSGEKVMIQGAAGPLLHGCPFWGEDASADPYVQDWQISRNSHGWAIKCDFRNIFSLNFEENTCSLQFLMIYKDSTIKRMFGSLQPKFVTLLYAGLTTHIQNHLSPENHTLQL